MRLLLFLSLCLFVSPLLYADQPQVDLDVAKRLLKQGEEERLVWVADLQQGLRSNTTDKQFVKSYAVTIRKVNAMRGSFLPTLMLDKDSIGVIRKGRSKDVETFDTERSRPMKLFQIIDKENALTEWSEGIAGDSTLVWLKGFSTDGLADGKTVTISRPVRVTGSKQYTTAMGTSKTVMVIEPCDIDEKTLVQAAKELRLKAKK